MLRYSEVKVRRKREEKSREETDKTIEMVVEEDSDQTIRPPHLTVRP